LHDRLALLAAPTLAFALKEWQQGRLRPVAQPEEGISYAPPLRKEEVEIRWDRPPRSLLLQVRAFAPKPGAYTFYRGMRVKILKARIAADECGSRPPGAVLSLLEGGIRVAAGHSGSLLLQQLQPEGGKPVSASEFARGYRLRAGDCLGGQASPGPPDRPR
jgi:methionyl-tRNA formyltransferase